MKLNDKIYSKPPYGFIKILVYACICIQKYRNVIYKCFENKFEIELKTQSYK